MLASPHGLELLDTGNTTASDIAEAGEARLRDIYADWLQHQADAGRISLHGPADAVADAISAALKGIKSACTNHTIYKTRIATFAALVGAALRT